MNDELYADLIEAEASLDSLRQAVANDEGVDPQAVSTAEWLVHRLRQEIESEGATR